MRVTLRIVVEGQTEETFVKQILIPHLSNFSVDASTRLLTTKELAHYTYDGGLSSYAQAKRDINLSLRADQDDRTRVTTMFDLYRLRNDFPGFCVAASHSDPYRRVQILEDALAEKIDDDRFIPYIQLHEFEALLLSDPRKFESWFDNCMDGITRLEEMVTTFESPEHVNDDEPPSKRLGRELLNYKHFKTAAGPIVAERIGLPTMRSKCKHFASWLAKLEKLATEN